MIYEILHVGWYELTNFFDGNGSTSRCTPFWVDRYSQEPLGILLKESAEGVYGNIRLQFTRANKWSSTRLVQTREEFFSNVFKKSEIIEFDINSGLQSTTVIPWEEVIPKYLRRCL